MTQVFTTVFATILLLTIVALGPVMADTLANIVGDMEYQLAEAVTCMVGAGC
ncbi:MAG: hypothetical protein AAGA69_10720 [Pseudomonadota bacterium]